MGRAILLLLLSACSGCTRAMVKAEGTYEAAIIQGTTMPQAFATTRCTLNNLPLIVIDSATWVGPDVEIVLRHEETHAQRAYEYRGGCWPYMYRIARDKAFRAQEQLLAFCEAARFAMKRNRNPESAWEYIVNVMRPDSTLTSKDNCLYQPWERQ